MAISPNLRAIAYPRETTGKPVALKKSSSIVLFQDRAVTIRETMIQRAYQCFITALYLIPTLFENKQLSSVFARYCQWSARLSREMFLFNTAEAKEASVTLGKWDSSLQIAG